MAISTNMQLPQCELCGEAPIVKTEFSDDRCQLCAENTCAKCGDESLGDYCKDCGFIPKN